MASPCQAQSSFDDLRHQDPRRRLQVEHIVDQFINEEALFFRDFAGQMLWPPFFLQGIFNYLLVVNLPRMVTREFGLLKRLSQFPGDFRRSGSGLMRNGDGVLP